MDFSWAVNKTKMARAIKAVKDSGAEVTEAAVKALYITYAGHVAEEGEIKKAKTGKK